MNRCYFLFAMMLLASCMSNQKKSAAASDPFQFDMKEYDRQRVLAAADQYLNEKPDTITSHPCDRSPGGLHDFYSEADYSWPATNPNAPFINRDGYSYPRAFFDHRRAMWRFDIQVSALVSAYLITNDRKYADHAVDHLRAWFVNPDTRMNPSL